MLLASLHEAIAELLPTRLEFYETWLSTSGLKTGRITMGPWLALLSFLRIEGDAYPSVTRRAGQHAADWTAALVPPIQQSIVLGLPPPLKARLAVRLACRMVRLTHVRTRAVVRWRRGVAHVELRESPFCVVREPWPSPLCAFYAEAFARFLGRFDVAVDAQIGECRGAGSPRCTILLRRRVDETP